MIKQRADGERTKLLQDVLTELRELNRSPVGRVMYDQVARLVGEHENLQTQLNQTYSLLVHLLLDAYARAPEPEHLTRLHAKLIEWREGTSPEPAARDASGAAPPPDSPSEEPAARQIEIDDDTPASQPPAPPTETPAENGTTAVSERRTNSAYRLHLDRKRDEIEKLQEALASNVYETITQNREFGAMLQIELRALQQAEGAKEIEELRHILIGGIEELIQGQRMLDTKLGRTADYLSLVKTDSERLREELHKVRLLSLTDEFTGLPNRRAFMRRLQDEIGRAQRYHTRVALALIDLDEFKAINDEHGHAVGDQVLRCYAINVLSILRHHDMAARYGGEEFAVLLPNTNEHGALAALNKLRHRAREVQCLHEGNPLPIPTFSAGITLYLPGEPHTALIDRADRALYRAKRLGRNRIETELSAQDGASAERETSSENGPT